MGPPSRGGPLAPPGPCAMTLRLLGCVRVPAPGGCSSRSVRPARVTWAGSGLRSAGGLSSPFRVPALLVRPLVGCAVRRARPLGWPFQASGGPPQPGSAPPLGLW